MASYLPKRALKQFGYVQRIPLDPPKCLAAYGKCCKACAEWEQHLVALARLFHMGLHGPALYNTCLGITSIQIHNQFRHRKENHHIILFVFCCSLNLIHNLVVVRYQIMYQVLFTPVR
ncbi:hypothetical protein AAZV13_05G087500 [Glycine max]